MRITRSILLFVTLLGCAGHAAAVVSADWEPERLVLVFEPQNDNSKNTYHGLNDFSWQNTLSAEQLRAARRALIAKKKALLAKKKRQMAQKALMDAQRERVKPVAVQSVPEIDGQYAGLALALMLALCLVMRERARQSS
ncbi:MAG: hypothetical protein RIC89_10260 [Pseudomonadales bacterium]